jgi:hypothetical protein
MSNDTDYTALEDRLLHSSKAGQQFKCEEAEDYMTFFLLFQLRQRILKNSTEQILGIIDYFKLTGSCQL